MSPIRDRQNLLRAGVIVLGVVASAIVALSRGEPVNSAWLLIAAGILIARPDLQIAAVTKYIDGTGPVWAGGLFPLLFITIACGSVYGWHVLIASGTAPKMIENENQIPLIRYGAMLTESFAAIMAMTGASVIHPVVCFAMNTSARLIGTTADHAVQAISH